MNANIALAHGYDGTGIGVAVLDSGVNQAADLNGQQWGSRVIFSQSFVPGQNWFSASDQYGHGTHVAGIVAGDASLSDHSYNTYTFRGIAPNANIINLQVLDQNGDGAVIAAIEEAVFLKPFFNIRVMNLSLGRLPSH